MYIHKIERDKFCPTEYGINIFGGKWKPRVLCLLSIKGTLRYKDIKDFTPDIADNVLATVMRDLAAARLVDRMQYNEVPLRVEYSLTDNGLSLIPIIHSICRWAADTYGREVAGSDKTCPYVALRTKL